MKSTLQRLEEIRRNGYRLDVGETINEIFENYKKIALLSGAVLLLFFIGLMIIFGGFAAVFVGLATLTTTLTDISQGIPLTATALVINLVVSTVTYGFLAVIAAGIIQMAHNASINEDFDFGTAFSHFKSEHFKELFMGGAIVTLVGSGIGVVFQLAMAGDYLSTFAKTGSGISGLLSGLISLFTLIMVPMIIFGKLKAFEAIKGSFVVVSKNFWTILLLSIVFLIFAMLGFIAICIGIFFTLPVFYSMQYVIYKTALPIDETNELDQIGKDFF